MRSYIGVLLLTVVVLTGASAIPKTNEHKTSEDRIKERELSDEEHYKVEDHNIGFDHEAFLGKEEAKTFDDLTPEESKERLGIIYDKIDKDKDGFVTPEELREWIKYVQNKYIWSDTDRQWSEHEPEDGKLHWNSYRKKTYGFMDDQETDDQDEDGYNYKDMIKRDEKRWDKADQDSDKQLTKEEFADFLHPEEKEHMRDIVIDETLDDIDKDKDGFISLEEYIEDLWDPEDEQEEPDWIIKERSEFQTIRDKNGDGMMDRDEIAEWILPDDGDYVQEESKHLIGEADADKDDKLTKEEVLEKYDLFVGSQATDFGEALSRHDEF